MTHFLCCCCCWWLMLLLETSKWKLTSTLKIAHERHNAPSIFHRLVLVCVFCCFLFFLKFNFSLISMCDRRASHCYLDASLFHEWFSYDDRNSCIQRNYPFEFLTNKHLKSTKRREHEMFNQQIVLHAMNI